MIEPEPVESSLPELDCTDDPRGGAAGWALLMVGVVLVGAVIIVVVWVW